MDAKEFTERFYPFHPKLYRVACALLDDPDDAADILQDTYIRLWDKRNDLSELQNPEGFCLRLLRNLCIDFMRSPARRGDSDYPEIVLLTTATTPESEIVSKESIQRIESLIDRLPEKQRKVLMMRTYGDCASEEIEAATGESAVNVRALLSRARRTLKEWLNNTEIVS